ncbi:DDE-type integrase/transposase/recombinase [Antarctobacter sp.]|uniref:DDE-type integrase/transposase/recombinase n=1 Tax=Antarctobacter sp. TaxID=1872577 RepID=UPI003A9282FC
MAGLTYLTITGGLAYAALILDAWSRRVVGCAIGRGIDARLAVKALRQAIALRRPLPGCVFHTDAARNTHQRRIATCSRNMASSAP